MCEFSHTVAVHSVFLVVFMAFYFLQPDVTLISVVKYNALHANKYTQVYV